MCMDENEIIKICEDFDFSLDPEARMQYMLKQYQVMKRYLINKRISGDWRDKNIILIEWIKSENSRLFRVNWLREFLGLKGDNNVMEL